MEASPSSSLTILSMATPTSERRRDDPIIHPERPGEPVCTIYKNHRRCNFGAACIFDHPTDLQPMEPKKQKRGEKKPRLSLYGFTFEQQQAHFERVKETDGFHVGYVPLGSRRGGMIYPVPLSGCGSIPKNLAKFAISGYNEEHAKDGKPGSRPQNFQTRVFKSIRETEVHLCRLEQKKSTLPEGPGENRSRRIL